MNIHVLQYLVLASLTLSVLLSGLILWLTIRLKKLDRIRSEFYKAGEEQNLEQVLIDQNRKLSKLHRDAKGLQDDLTDLSVLNKNNIQKIGFIRFNPFEDAGGNMSFALALLNDHDDGVVISSLHAREGTRIYAKAIKAGGSEHKLTEEELEAIKHAK